MRFTRIVYMSTCGAFNLIGLYKGLVNIWSQCKGSVITPLAEKTRRLNAPGFLRRRYVAPLQLAGRLVTGLDGVARYRSSLTPAGRHGRISHAGLRPIRDIAPVFISGILVFVLNEPLVAAFLDQTRDRNGILARVAQPKPLAKRLIAHRIIARIH